MKAVTIALNLASLGLVAVLAWLIVRIIVGLTQTESLYQPEPIVQPAKLSPQAAASVNFDFSTNPFAFGETFEVPLELFDDAPETTLNLKLIGIVSQSSATFRLADGKNKPVKLDEEVINGVTLTATSRDFVTLNVNGEAQKLTLERVKLGEKETSAQIKRAAPQANSAPSLPGRQEAENLLSKIQLRPATELLPDRTTKMVGFRISARPGADLAQFNLKSGDIITRVGPVLLNTKRANIKELRDLLSSGAAQDFEVIRNGAPLTIRIGQ